MAIHEVRRQVVVRTPNVSISLSGKQSQKQNEIRKRIERTCQTLFSIIHIYKYLDNNDLREYKFDQTIWKAGNEEEIDKKKTI